MYRRWQFVENESFVESVENGVAVLYSDIVATFEYHHKAITFKSALQRLFNVASGTPEVVFLDFLESYLVRKRCKVLLKGKYKLFLHVGNIKPFTYKSYMQTDTYNHIAF